MMPGMEQIELWLVRWWNSRLADLVYNSFICQLKVLELKHKFKDNKALLKELEALDDETNKRLSNLLAAIRQARDKVEKKESKDDVAKID